MSQATKVFSRTVLIIVLILSGVFLITFLSSLAVIWGQKGERDWSGRNIAVNEIEGVITESLPTLEHFQKFRDNENFKALIIRIDSPGGAVGASQEIFMEVLKLKEERPVIISMGNVAASGGFYIAVAGTEIYALPGSITGSMGVMMPLTNLARLMDRLHIDPMPIRSGELKDAGNPLKPVEEKAKEYLQEMVDSTFVQFRDHVTGARALSPEVVTYLSDARVISGAEALELGIVDSLGTFRDAVERAKELAELDEARTAFISRTPRGLIERVLHGSLHTFWTQVTKQLSSPYYIGPTFLGGGEY